MYFVQAFPSFRDMEYGVLDFSNKMLDKKIIGPPIASAVFNGIIDFGLSALNVVDEINNKRRDHSIEKNTQENIDKKKCVLVN